MRAHLPMQAQEAAQDGGRGTGRGKAAAGQRFPPTKRRRRAKAATGERSWLRSLCGGSTSLWQSPILHVSAPSAMLCRPCRRVSSEHLISHCPRIGQPLPHTHGKQRQSQHCRLCCLSRRRLHDRSCLVLRAPLLLAAAAASAAGPRAAAWLVRSWTEPPFLCIMLRGIGFY